MADASHPVPWLQLRAERNRQGLTLAALARRAEMNLSHLSQLEKGNGRPQAGTVNKLATALGVPASVLFPGGSPEGVITEELVRKISREVCREFFVKEGIPEWAEERLGHIEHDLKAENSRLKAEIRRLERELGDKS